MLAPRTSGLSRRATLGSLGALALSAAISRGSPLAWAQRTDTPGATLSDLSMRRPPQRTLAASSGLVWQGYAADATNVRAEPNTDSEITRELEPGESVVV